MAVGTPNVGTATGAAAATTTAVPFPATVNAGDLCLLIGSTGANSSTSITTPAGWTQREQLQASSSAPCLYVAFLFATGTEGGTSVTVTHTSTPSAWQILAFSGVDSTTPFDVADSTVAGATTATTTVIPGVTVVTTGAALVACAALNSSGATATPPSGFTETLDNPAAGRAFEISFELAATAGATGSQTVTWSGTAKSVGALLALRPIASSPASLTGAVAAVATAALAGSVTTVRAVTAAGAVSGMTLAAPAGAVVTTAPIALTGGVSTLAAAAPAGLVATTSDVGAGGALVGLVVAAPSGTVTTTRAVSLTGGTGTLVLVAPAGSSAATVVVSGPVSALELAALAGQVSIVAALEPDDVDVTLTAVPLRRALVGAPLTRILTSAPFQRGLTAATYARTLEED